MNQILTAHDVKDLNDYVEKRDAILRAQFFLVRIAGNGMGLRCRICHTKHTYLTLMCIEQPFNGIDGGLYAFWRTIGATKAELSPAQQDKYDRLTKTFGGEGLEDYKKSDSSLHVADTDMDMGALSLGVLEPISKEIAADRVKRINEKLHHMPKLIVDGINGKRDKNGILQVFGSI